MKKISRILAFLILAGLSFISVLRADEPEVRDVFKTNIPAPLPNQPVRYGPTPTVQTVLQGIGMGPKGMHAVISGQIYHAGEEKQGIKVAKIRKKEVDIIVNGAQSTLRMIPSSTSSAEGGPSDGRMPSGPEAGDGMIPGMPGDKPLPESESSNSGSLVATNKGSETPPKEPGSTKGAL